MKRSLLATMMIVALSGVASAQAPADDPHHPPAATAPTPSPTQPTPPGQSGTSQPQGMMGGGMMSMMRDMPMKNMMGMMRMMGPGSAGMATIDRVEGRIAFLRAELKITEAQAAAWNAFADALRANAKKLGDVRASMMSQPAAAQQQAPTLTGRLDAQERWLVARLQGTRAIKVAFTPLYGTFSDDQKKAADELLGPHMGMGMMAMTPGQSGQMQPGQMGPGQMRPGQMQPGQMQPGQMQPGQMQPGQMQPGKR
jgi:LTXXQ motif family protein